MKLLLFVLGLCCVSFSLMAQKVQNNDYTFTYVRLPQNPLDASIKNYSTVVVLDAEAAYKKALAEREDELKKAEEDYQAALIQWEADKKEAEAKYKAEMEEWDSKSTAQKIIDKKVLDEGGKPVLREPSQPYKRTVPEPIKPIVDDPNSLGNTYIKLVGYTKGTDKPVVVQVTVKEYEKLGPELKVSESTMVKDGNSYKVKKYSYEYSHKYPMVLEIKSPNGQLLHSKLVESTTEYTVEKTKEYNDETTLRKTWDPNTMPKKYEEELLLANMKVVNEELNSLFGYTPIERKIAINTVKPSKYEYSEYDKAYESTLMAYSKMNQAGSEEAIITSLQTAVEQWENALKESDPDDRKARIDNDVTVATRLNLAEAYIWLDQFDQADLQLVKLIQLKTNNSEEKLMEELRSLIKDERDRHNANKG